MSVNTLDGKLALPLHLPPRGHALWLVSDKPSTAKATPAPHYSDPLPLTGPAEITRLTPNLLPIDYCDLQVGKRTKADMNTLHADAQNWKWQGFGSSPWIGQHQFRETNLSRPIDPMSDLTVHYHIQIESSLPQALRDSLTIGIERPWLYQISLNGHELPQTSARPWFDEHMREFPTRGHLVAGENILSLTAKPFNILCEIMPIYLMGDFSAEPIGRGFTAGGPAALSLGEWQPKGIPFYPGWTRYRYSFTLAKPAGIQIQIPHWQGSAARAQLDGKMLGAILHPPYTLDVTETIPAGQHQLDIKICGNMQNMMGPFHSEGLAGHWTWERSPAHQPAGADYRFEPTGLLAPPIVRQQQS